jgi:phosphoglycolate phosphatase
MPALIFDLDGTLVDSRADITASVLHALASRGRTSGLSPAAVGALVGQPLQAMFALADPTVDAAELGALAAAYREHYSANCAVASRLYPGVRDALVALRDRGPIACATTKRPDQTRCVLAAFDLLLLLHAWRGTSPDQRYKPAPDVILAAAADLGVAPADVIYVGDTVTDLQAARAAGARSAWVTWGYGDEAACRAEQPDHVLRSAADLLRLGDRP